MKKKYLLLFLTFALVFLSAVGSALWVILDEEVEGPKKYTKLNINEVDQTLLETELPTAAPFYYGAEDVSLTGGSVTYMGQEIEGAWSVEDTHIDASSALVSGTTNTITISNQLKVNFTPNDPLFDNTSIQKVYETANMYAVAYRSSTYYTTIEYALENSTSGTIYVIPELKNNNQVYKPKITRDCILKKDVDLSLPYSGETVSERTEAKYTVAYNSPNTYLKSEVELQAKLTVNGTLTVGGQYNAGGGGKYTGQTYGNYAQITFGEGANIVVNSGGEINAYGFIKSSKNHDQFVFESGAKLLMPFVLYEFRGGSISTAMQNADNTFDTCPFIRFACQNIDGAYKIKYGATADAKASLAAAGQTAEESTTVIGTESSALLQLFEGGYANVSYDHSTMIDGLAGTTQLDLYGGAKLNALDIEKRIATKTIRVSSLGAYLPLTYLHKINLYAGSYDLQNQNIKLMPGTSFNVGSDATVTAKNIVVYEHEIYIGAPVNGSGCNFKKYPSIATVGLASFCIEGGGRLDMQKFGGKITAGNGDGAQLNIKNGIKIEDSRELFDDYTVGSSTPNPDYVSQTNSNPKVYEPGWLEGALGGDAVVLYYNIHEYSAEGKIYINGNDQPQSRPMNIGKYYSRNGGWYQEAITVDYQVNGGTPVTSKTVQLSPDGYYALELPLTSRDYYTFAGWYYDSEFENKAESGDVLYQSATLYAKWNNNTYNVKYSNIFPAGFEDVQVTLPSTFQFSFDSASHTLATPVYNGEDLKFDGWYYYNSNGVLTPISSSVTGPLLASCLNDKTNGATLELFARWVKANAALVTVTFELADVNEITKAELEASGYKSLITNVYGAECTKQYPEEDFEGGIDLASLIGYDKDVSKQYYFVGWYDVDGNLIANGKLTTVPEGEGEKAITVYAGFGKKAKVSVNKFNGSSEASTDVIYLSAGQTYNEFGSDSRENDQDPEGITKYEFSTWTISSGSEYASFNDAKTELTVNDQSIGKEIIIDPDYITTKYYFVTITLSKGSNNEDDLPDIEIDCSGHYHSADSGANYKWKEDKVDYDGEGTYYVALEEGRHNYTSVNCETKTGSITVPDEKTISLKTEVKSSGPCIAEGTLITLADGRQVAVENLTGDEQLLVWNMLTGKFESAPILFIDSDPRMNYEVINLYFSDGTQVKVIGEHGFWDMEESRYVYLDASNSSSYIGHWFNKQVTNASGEMSWTKVQLTKVVIATENTVAYSPVTANHLCYYVNGMLSMPGGISGMFNFFEVDSKTMTIDKAKMQADIEKYGLFTYEEFAELVPVTREVFEVFNGKYLKIAIGKGNITIEQIIALAQRYGKFFEQ